MRFRRRHPPGHSTAAMLTHLRPPPIGLVQPVRYWPAGYDPLPASVALTPPFVKLASGLNKNRCRRNRAVASSRHEEALLAASAADSTCKTGGNIPDGSTFGTRYIRGSEQKPFIVRYMGASA